MEVIITVIDPEGEMTIRQDKDGKRFLQVNEDPPIESFVLDEAIDLIERNKGG